MQKPGEKNNALAEERGNRKQDSKSWELQKRQPCEVSSAFSKIPWSSAEQRIILKEQRRHFQTPQYVSPTSPMPRGSCAPGVV